MSGKNIFFGLLVCFVTFSSNVYAEDVNILPDLDYSGELTERSTLSGDWVGYRNSLSKKGIQFDNSLTYVAGFVLDGGLDGPIASRFFEGQGEEENHASWDNVLQIDTGKLGLWPGGVFKFRGEGRVGEGVNARAGALSPVDTDMLLPLNDFGDTIYDLTEATFTQFVSERLGFVVGVLNTLDGDALTLAGSTRGTAQFFNQAFQFNPVQTKSVPYKTFGGGAIILPTAKLEELLVTALVFNTEDSSGKNPFDRDSGTTVALEVNHGFRLFDRPGKHLAGFLYGDDDFSNLDDPRIILPGPLGTTKDETWAAYYSFEHYLLVSSENDGETNGIGVFGRFGFSDGNPNPIEFSYSLGVGGNAPWREKDKFGIGYYYIDVSDESVVDVLRVEDEQGLELWYNVEVVPWLHFTPDLQIIDPGTPGADTVYVLGLRTHAEF